MLQVYVDTENMIESLCINKINGVQKDSGKNRTGQYQGKILNGSKDEPVLLYCQVAVTQNFQMETLFT